MGFRLVRADVIHICIAINSRSVIHDHHVYLTFPYQFCARWLDVVGDQPMTRYPSRASGCWTKRPPPDPESLQGVSHWLCDRGLRRQMSVQKPPHPVTSTTGGLRAQGPQNGGVASCLHGRLALFSRPPRRLSLAAWSSCISDETGGKEGTTRELLGNHGRGREAGVHLTTVCSASRFIKQLSTLMWRRSMRRQLET